MYNIFRYLFAACAVFGLILVMIAGCSIDTAAAGDLGRILILGIIGGGVSAAGILGFNSLERDAKHGK